MKKLISSLMLICALICAVPSQGQNYHDGKMMLKVVCEQMQSMLPMKLNDMVTTTAMSYDEASNTLRMSCNVMNEALYDNISQSNVNDSATSLVKMYKDMGIITSGFVFSIEITYRSPSGRTKTVRISESEMKGILSTLKSQGASQTDIMESFRKELQNFKFPVVIDEHTTLTDVRIKGTKITYMYEASDLLYDTLKNNGNAISLLKTNTINNLKGNFLARKDDLISQGVTFIYEYYKAGSSLPPVTFTITSAEIFR